MSCYSQLLRFLALLQINLLRTVQGTTVGPDRRTHGVHKEKSLYAQTLVQSDTYGVQYGTLCENKGSWSDESAAGEGADATGYMGNREVKAGVVPGEAPCTGAEMLEHSINQ